MFSPNQVPEDLPLLGFLFPYRPGVLFSLEPWNLRIPEREVKRRDKEKRTIEVRVARGLKRVYHSLHWW